MRTEASGRPGARTRDAGVGRIGAGPSSRLPTSLADPHGLGLGLLATVIGAGMVVGCGQGVVESRVPATSELHGGVLIPLSDGTGFVELLNGPRQKRGKAYETTVVAYVLQPDAKTPIAESPASVQVRIGTPNGERTLPLQASPETGDPVGSRRFVSSPGPFDLNQNGGEVTVQVGGKSLTGSFRGPR